MSFANSSSSFFKFNTEVLINIIFFFLKYIYFLIRTKDIITLFMISVWSIQKDPKKVVYDFKYTNLNMTQSNRKMYTIQTHFTLLGNFQGVGNMCCYITRSNTNKIAEMSSSYSTDLWVSLYTVGCMYCKENLYSLRNNTCNKMKDMSLTLFPSFLFNILNNHC